MYHPAGAWLVPQLHRSEKIMGRWKGIGLSLLKSKVNENIQGMEYHFIWIIKESNYSLM